MKTRLLLAALFLTSSAFSQNTLSGTVAQEHSGEILPFANLALMQGDNIITGVTADVSGFYEITDIPNGDYELIASYVGFQTLEQKLSFADQSHQQNFELQEGINLKEVVIESEPVEFARRMCTYTSCSSSCRIFRPYYRIFDTTATDSTSLVNRKRRRIMSIFPNPTSGLNLSVTYNNDDLNSNYPVRLQVYSAIGVLVSSRELPLSSGRLQFQLTDLAYHASGYYFVEILDGEHRLTKKVIVR